MHQAVDILRSEGHQVDEVELPYRKEDLSEAFLVVIAGELAGEINLMAQYLGRPVRPGDVEPNTFAFYLLGRSFSAEDYTSAKRKWGEISRRIAAYHERYDLLLTPTLAKRPIRIGSLQPTAVEKRLITVINALRWGGAVKATIQSLADQVYDYIPWTPLANLTGQPSMSVPMLRTAEENLPVGVMFTGRVGEEDVLYRLAGQLEKVSGK